MSEMCKRLAFPRRSRHARVTLAIIAAAGVLGGCTVGPDYATPEQATQQAWTGAQGAASDRPVGATPVAQPAQVEQWWLVFNDDTLNGLIDRAIAGNLTLAQAEARITQARGALAVTGSAQFPQVNGSTSASRSRTPVNGGGKTGNFFHAGFDATWELDVFGGVRRGVEAAQADVAAAELSRAATQVSLAAEVATSYFQLRGAQRQLAVARENLDAQNRTLVLTRQRLEAGFVSALDVANARANATQTESLIPSFDASIRSTIYALSVLIGEPPETLLAELEPNAPMPAIPTHVPIGMPSELLLRRPDIRQADAALHAATARVGVAIADQYPKFSLSGAFGTQGRQIESLGTLADRAWSFGPAISVPIFTGGRIEGNIEQAKAVAEQATLAYRQTVLTALQDVETALVNFTREQQRRDAVADSADANQQAVNLSLQLYNAGRTDFLDVLTAQRQLYSTQAQLSQAETNVAVDLIALFKALGGGWELPPSQQPSQEPSPVSRSTR